MKLNWRQTVLIGLGLFGLNMMWKLYNDYVPIFLQAGNPLFDAHLAVKTSGFGLQPGITGVIMTLDNVAGLLLMPLIGIWSDRIWTRWGRRKPFIVTLAPFSIIAFVLIPLIVKSIPPALSGQTASLQRPLLLLVVTIGVFITTMAGFRNPILSLMPDLTPSPLRSQANGIVNLMGGISGVLITFVGAWLHARDIAAPFIVGAATMALTVLVLVLTIQEPRTLAEVEPREEGAGLATLKQIRTVPTEIRPSLFFLVLAIFIWFVAFNAIETFLTSYCVNVLGVKENQAALLSGVPYLVFIGFAVPAGFLSARYGRRRIVILGLLAFAAVLLLGFLFPTLPVTIGVLALAGCAWALININGLPLVVDSAPTDAAIGTFTGIYFIGSQLAAVVGPVLNGWIIETTRNYKMVLATPMVFFLLAALTMRGVTRGEAR